MWQHYGRKTKSFELSETRTMNTVTVLASTSCILIVVREPLQTAFNAFLLLKNVKTTY